MTCYFCGLDPYERGDYGQPLGLNCCEELASFDSQRGRFPDSKREAMRWRYTSRMGYRLRRAAEWLVGALAMLLARLIRHNSRSTALGFEKRVGRETR